ncbi:MAG: CPBP family intramembrane metalloprotease [Oscillospiraceae bacterium]|nr:CPBP family intramembrane metalloprotease [Oscillospiraceae bacterium]
MEEENKNASALPKKKRHFILAVFVIAVALTLVGQLAGALIMLPFKIMADGADDSIQFLFMYLEFIGIDILVLLYCAVFEKEIFRSFLGAGRGGGRGNRFRSIGFGLLIGFAMNGICILAAWLHGDLRFSVGDFRLIYLICALLSVFVQSCAEELVTRGYMMGALKARYRGWIAIVGNALFFGLFHLLNTGITVVSFLEIVGIGLALSLVVYYFESIWMAAAIHTSWNFTQNFLFGLPNSGFVSKGSFLHLEAASDSILYDTVFGVEGAIPALIVTAVLAAAVIVYARKKTPKSDF